MNATTISQPVHPWSAAAYTRRAPVVALTGLPTNTKTNPRKQFAPVSHRIVWDTWPVHPDVIEVDCRHWDEPERWADEQPVPEIVGEIGDTEWNALPVILGDGGLHGKLPRHAYSSGGYLKFVSRPAATPETAPFAPNTAPLVAARERKEAELRLNISAKNVCLPADGKAPLAYIKDTAEHDLVMCYYLDRIKGAPGAQERWDAISAGMCKGLTVAESLARFGRKVTVTA